MAGCEGAASNDFGDFCTFLINFGSQGVPGMPLGTLGDHLCAGTPEKVDFGVILGVPGESFWHPGGTYVRLWARSGGLR